MCWSALALDVYTIYSSLSIVLSLLFNVVYVAIRESKVNGSRCHLDLRKKQDNTRQHKVSIAEVTLGERDTHSKL